MKKTAIALLVLGLTATASASALAALVTDDFTYPDGDITVVSGGNWVNHSGAGVDVKVVSNHAVGDMLQSPDVNRGFAARSATDKTFACFQVIIPAISGSPRTNYFAHFKDATTGFTSRVYVVPSGSTFTFALGTGSTPTVTWPADLAYDTAYIIAISYDAATGVAELWVDPADETSPKITTAPGVMGLQLQGFALRQSNTGTGTAWTYQVDDLSVGTTFDDACPGATPTKSTTWGRVKSLYR
jgi:hypothetical protein